MCLQNVYLKVIVVSFVSFASAKYFVSICKRRKFYSKSFPKETMTNSKNTSSLSSVTANCNAKFSLILLFCHLPFAATMRLSVSNAIQ